jgi:hypothetical protein
MQLTILAFSVQDVEVMKGVRHYRSVNGLKFDEQTLRSIILCSASVRWDSKNVVLDHWMQCYDWCGSTNKIANA